MGLSRDFTVIIHLIICSCFCKNIEIINSNQSRFFPCNFKIRVNLIILWLWEPEYYSRCSVWTTNWTVGGWFQAAERYFVFFKNVQALSLRPNSKRTVISFPGSKVAEVWSLLYSAPSRAEFKKECRYASTPPYAFYSVQRGW